jgi:hypothetical protein
MHSVLQLLTKRLIVNSILMLLIGSKGKIQSHLYICYPISLPPDSYFPDKDIRLLTKNSFSSLKPLVTDLTVFFILLTFNTKCTSILIEIIVFSGRYFMDKVSGGVEIKH